MQVPDFLKKAGFWTLHILGWTLLNVLLGSLPFVVTLLRGEDDNPFLVGLLCFCFTAASSGLYSILASSFKGEQSGLEKGLNFFLLCFAVVWMVAVWTVVLKLPSIIDILGSENIYSASSILYISSVALFFIANLKLISGLVNDNVAKYLIMNPVSNSKEAGSSWRKSLEDEGEF